MVAIEKTGTFEEGCSNGELRSTLAGSTSLARVYGRTPSTSEADPVFRSFESNHKTGKRPHMIMDGWVGSPENAMDDTRKMTEIDMGGVVIALDNIDDNGLPYVTKALAKRVVRQAIGVKLPLRGPVTINGKIEQRQYVNRGQAGIFKGCFGGHRIVTNRHNFALKQGEKPRGCAVGIHTDMINDSEDEYILSFQQEHHQDNLYPLKWPDPTLKWTWPFGDDVLWARLAKVSVQIPAM